MDIQKSSKKVSRTKQKKKVAKSKSAEEEILGKDFDENSKNNLSTIKKRIKKMNY